LVIFQIVFGTFAQASTILLPLPAEELGL
jgi:hypothetical protein